ncbi:Biopolymer transport protein ExbD/TolR [Candidatus Burkholderia verschuerenii]|uniref:Biopolymer transport protein ExbD/TolR n=1 Tax=Candidatus Burkholderia verschuerenii TaxID=242163 RepID=A0A0L0M4X4_9BURK|nr:biopolymer transporter ExbD [Candidatus Burkholderia verschuerenii]KND57433.1 Biopolymer transport protein ExbD/TolR [Candidatus Burkholderia verschuerenii]
MAFGGLDKKPSGAPMAEINMTPLIDVMLVLLVIFIITAPLFIHAIRLDLPKVAAQPAREMPQTITLSIDDSGKLFWNDQPIGFDAMRGRFVEAGKASEKPELHLRASSGTRYDVIAQVMGAAQQAGVERIGFVTQPVVDQRTGARPGEKK